MFWGTLHLSLFPIYVLFFFFFGNSDSYTNWYCIILVSPRARVNSTNHPYWRFCTITCSCYPIQHHFLSPWFCVIQNINCIPKMEAITSHLLLCIIQNWKLYCIMLNLDDLYHINCITSIVFHTWMFVSSKIGLLFNKIVFKRDMICLGMT